MGEAEKNLPPEQALYVMILIVSHHLLFNKSKRKDVTSANEMRVLCRKCACVIEYREKVCRWADVIRPTAGQDCCDSSRFGSQMCQTQTGSYTEDKHKSYIHNTLGFVGQDLIQHSAQIEEGKFRHVTNTRGLT